MASDALVCVVEVVHLAKPTQRLIFSVLVHVRRNHFHVPGFDRGEELAVPTTRVTISRCRAYRRCALALLSFTNERVERVVTNEVAIHEFRACVLALSTGSTEIAALCRDVGPEKQDKCRAAHS